MSAPLFGRRAWIVVGRPGPGARRVEGLRVAFKVTKKDGASINTATITVYNAAPETLARATEGGASIQLYAGYGEAASLIFLGTVTRCVTKTEGPDRVTEIESGDDSKQKGARVSETVKTPKIGGVLGKLAALGAKALDLGDLDPNAPLAASPRGVALSGHVWGQVARVARLNKLDWTIDDGTLVVVRSGEARGLPAFRLAPDSGLVGSPQPADKGRVKIRSLLQPEMRLKRLVALESREVSGWWIAREVEHTGDTHGQDFYTDTTASKIGSRT